MKYTTFDWNIWWSLFFFFSLNLKAPCLFLNKYNRISLFLYKWNVMHIFPSKKKKKKLHEIVKETKESGGLRGRTKTLV